MKLTRVLTRLAVGSAAMLLPVAPSGAASSGIEVGDRFPELVLPALEGGKPLSIRSFRGRKVALHVWASW